MLKKLKNEVSGQLFGSKKSSIGREELENSCNNSITNDISSEIDNKMMFNQL